MVNSVETREMGKAEEEGKEEEVDEVEEEVDEVEAEDSKDLMMEFYSMEEGVDEEEAALRLAKLLLMEKRKSFGNEGGESKKRRMLAGDRVDESEEKDGRKVKTVFEESRNEGAAKGVERYEKIGDRGAREVMDRHGQKQDGDGYSIVNQLKTVTAGITLFELLRSAPRYRRELMGALRKHEANSVGATREEPINKRRRKYDTTAVKCTVEILGRRINAILDTGAAVSVINAELAEELGLREDREPDKKLVTADGGEHIPRGIISSVKIQVHGFDTRVDLAIFEGLGEELLLGVDWCLENVATPDLIERKLVIKRNGVKAYIPVRVLREEESDCEEEEEEEEEEEDMPKV
ncbi:uncharacterized protein VTP21DRAFT_1505, partial [Calcarisporiella thermophila]|uniref:uncharacterized protein n=1 Tax=Calcarisporiella thermophila TaxID=911321 RepID=UPI003743116C